MTPTRLICPHCHEVYLLGEGCDCEREDPPRKFNLFWQWICFCSAHGYGVPSCETGKGWLCRLCRGTKITLALIGFAVAIATVMMEI